MQNIKTKLVTYFSLGILFIYYSCDFLEIKIHNLFYITIFILSLCLVVKLFYWYKIGKSSEKENLLRLTFLILTYFLPIYMIIQKPTLIIDITTLKISSLIIFILALIGAIIERYLFIIKQQLKEN